MLMLMLMLMVMAAVVLWLSWRYKLGEPTTLISLLLSAASLVVAVASFVAHQLAVAAGKLDLAGVADQLANAVARQWEDEAAVRRLNDPYPLPVRWKAAPTDLVESWTSLERLARTGAGWAGSAPERWAAGPAELDGQGNEIIDRLDRVPTGRLVILGKPGAGKTVLAVRLVLDLLKRRPKGAPVPLLLPLASWNPKKQYLHDWLEDRLIIDHAGLTLPAPDGSGNSRARALLDNKLILPILDGLDEIPDEVRGPAIARLNDALSAQPLVLTARTSDYRAAVHPPGKDEVLLTGAAGIELCPLDAAAIIDYLGRSPGSTTSARWKPVLDTLTAPAPPPVAQALATPLMSGLAKVIYNPRPGEHTGDLPDPAELLDPSRFPNRTAVEQRLYDGFIPAAYRPHPNPAHNSRWSALQAEHWLVFLARHLEHRLHTTDLRMPEISSAIPGWVPRLAAGLVVALVAGLAIGLTAGLAAGLGVVLVAGLPVGLPVGLKVSQTEDENWSDSAGIALIYGFVVGLLVVVVVGLIVGFPVGFLVGLSVELGVVLVIGLAGGRRDTGIAFRVWIALWLVGMLMFEFPVGLWIWLWVGLAVFGFGALFGWGFNIGALWSGLVLTLLVGLMVGPGVGLAALLWAVFGVRPPLWAGAWLALGAGVGLLFELSTVTWLSFAIARFWLAMSRRLPWRLRGFLDDAHQQRQMLRKVGAVYQFRHAELQRRLATRP